MQSWRAAAVRSAAEQRDEVAAVDRGFSIRILIDIEEAEAGFVDTDWLVTNYGGGRGLTWMYNKRIEGLVETKLVGRNAEMIELTLKGKRAAALFVAARRLLRLESQA